MTRKAREDATVGPQQILSAGTNRHKEIQMISNEDAEPHNE